METKIYDYYPDSARLVREEVFMREQGFSYDYDEKDDEAVHIVVFDNGCPVGVCRIFRGEKENEFFFGRLAVKKEYRKNGIGSAVLGEALKYAASQGGRCLSLHSQLQAKEFYEKNGFEAYGEIDYEEGCPHIHMKKEICSEK